MSARLAFSYVRFSSLAQAGGDSVRRQDAGFASWCASNGATPADNYRDLGVSAFRGKNSTAGALREFLAAVEAGRIPPGSLLVVESLDRISRLEVNFALPIFLQIINAGVSVVTLADGHVYDASAPNMMMEMMYSLLIMSRANEESATKSHRGRESWERKRAEALAQPMSANGPFWLELREGKWHVREEAAAIVRRIFGMVLAGAGMAAVAKALNQDGIPAARGGKWRVSSLATIVDGRSVLGEFTPRSGPERRGGKRGIALAPIEGYFPAIISPEDWARVQRLRERRRHQKGRTDNPAANPFRGLIFCPEGFAFHLHAMTVSGKLYAYLRTSAGEAGAGRRHSWPLREFMALFTAVAIEASRAEIQPADDSGQVVRLQLEEVHAKIANLVGALGAAGASEALTAALMAAEVRRDALRATLALLEDAPPARASEADWTTEEGRAVAIAQTVRRITAESNAPRWFTVEFHDRAEPVTWRELPGGDWELEGLAPEAEAEAVILRPHFG
jgi:DNA invertase Pin-like site-specific DNA recombinase